MKKFFGKYAPIIILLLLSTLTFYRLLRPGIFSMQDDMHIFRLQQFDQCLKDGQIPCRYIPDAGLGYGYPLFNYYSPLPYAIGETFHLIGFSFIDSLKIVFIIIRLLAPIGMFLLAKLFFKNKAAFLAAAIFMFAPYQAIDGYVRGAIAESLAIVLIPFSIYFVLKKQRLAAVIFTTALFLSHNLFALISIPITLFFITLTSPKKLFSSLVPIIFSLGISAFFLIPAILEKNLVHLESMTQGYFNYIIHFATLNQLFVSRFWGYGASLWGPKDDMSFQVGIIQWLVPAISFPLLLISHKIKKNILFIPFILLGLFFVFLTHNQSTFIWKLLPFLAYFQFPWRFLGFAIIFFSLTSGYLITSISKKSLQLPLVVFITILTISLNLSYFKEDIWYSNLIDQQKLTGANLISAQGAGLKDYWPSAAASYPDQVAPSVPWTSNPQDQYILSRYSKTSNQLSLNIDVSSPEITLNLPLVYFPNWQLNVDRLLSPLNIDPRLGYIKVPLTSGSHQINLHLTNTPVRTVANIISIITLIFLFFYFFKDAKKP